jgi:hypothetical protein
MQHVTEFIKFAVSHADPKTVPNGAKIEFPVGNDDVWEYLWGTTGQVVTEKLLDARFKSYYSRNGWNRQEYETVTRGWVEDGVHVTDCQGLLDAFLHSDTNANGDYVKYCTHKGLIAAMNEPFVVGEAVFNGTDAKKTHVGWVCGFLGTDPLVVEARGLKYGVVITRMSKRSWKYRGLMTNKFSYDSVTPQEEPTEYVFRRSLKKGCKGDDVVKLKMLLRNAGYDRGITTNTGSSENFGSATKRLVKDYQRDNGLTVDGIAGRNTITCLGGKFE